MPKEYKLLYKIGQQVRINNSSNGVIMAVYLDSNGAKYEVRALEQKDNNTIFVHEWELSGRQEEYIIGFLDEK
jgi:hypothetical protein